MGRLIEGVTFEGGAVTMTYFTAPDDMRENGLVAQHQLTIPLGIDYDDEIEALVEAAQALLDDVLEDFPKVPVFIPAEVDVDDDDDGDDDDGLD